MECDWDVKLLCFLSSPCRNRALPSLASWRQEKCVVQNPKGGGTALWCVGCVAIQHAEVHLYLCVSPDFILVPMDVATLINKLKRMVETWHRREFYTFHTQPEREENNSIRVELSVHSLLYLSYQGFSKVSRMLELFHFLLNYLILWLYLSNKLSLHIIHWKVSSHHFFPLRGLPAPPKLWWKVIVRAVKVISKFMIKFMIMINLLFMIHFVSNIFNDLKIFSLDRDLKKYYVVN